MAKIGDAATNRLDVRHAVGELIADPEKQETSKITEFRNKAMGIVNGFAKRFGLRGQDEPISGPMLGTAPVYDDGTWDVPRTASLAMKEAARYEGMLEGDQSERASSLRAYLAQARKAANTINELQSEKMTRPEAKDQLSAAVAAVKCLTTVGQRLGDDKRIKKEDFEQANRNRCNKIRRDQKAKEAEVLGRKRASMDV